MYFVCIRTVNGHRDGVTCLSQKRLWCVETQSKDINSNITDFVSSSRDKSLIVWDISSSGVFYDCKHLRGHYHFVQCVKFLSNSRRCISGAWDTTLRLWHTITGYTTIRFAGHRNDVLCVTVSPDEFKIVSGSRDRFLFVWNRGGQCVFRLRGSKGRSGWVSSVIYRPVQGNFLVSAGWDCLVKIWSMQKFCLTHELEQHTHHVNTVTLSPDGCLGASGDREGLLIFWDVVKGRLVQRIRVLFSISCICFNPVRFWMAVSTSKSIKIWELTTKKIVMELKPEIVSARKGQPFETRYCTSLQWSYDGNSLFCGTSDSLIIVVQELVRN
jgi:guanine nucleotide-binding protein subunit beta-2-like 1 protein